MARETPSPTKDKKKKRSLFDDDDFFVIKKKKPKPASANTDNSTPSIKHESPQEPEPAASRLTPPKTSSDNIENDEINQSFHTADEASDLIIIADDPKDTNDNEVQTIDSDSDNDLDKFFNNIQASYKEKDTLENDRLYDITISSKTGRPQQFSITSAGNETFEHIIARLELLKAARTRNFPLKDGCLIWIDGKLEIKPFFKPSTLRLPAPDSGNTKISCLYVPKEHATNFEQIYEEFASKEEQEPELQNPVEVVKDSKEPENQTLLFFVIGLVGNDNKRVEAEVGPQTKLRAVLQHYLKMKGIDEAQASKARLVFDDEDLDLDGIVGDTELEEDFEVEVYI